METMFSPAAVGQMPAMPGQAPGPSFASMLGDQAQPQRSDLQEALKVKIGRFGELIATINALAQDAPESAQDFQRAIDSLRSAMMKVTARMTRGQEGAQPPVLG